MLGWLMRRVDGGRRGSMLLFPHRPTVPSTFHFPPPLFPSTHNTPLPNPPNPPDTHPTRTFTHPTPPTQPLSPPNSNSASVTKPILYIHYKPNHRINKTRLPPPKKRARRKKIHDDFQPPSPPRRRSSPSFFGISLSLFFAKKTGSRETFDIIVEYWR